MTIFLSLYIEKYAIIYIYTCLNDDFLQYWSHGHLFQTLEISVAEDAHSKLTSH